MFSVWTNQKYVIPDFGLFTCVEVMVGALIAILLARTRGMAWLGEIVGSFFRHV